MKWQTITSKISHFQRRTHSHRPLLQSLQSSSDSNSSFEEPVFLNFQENSITALPSLFLFITTMPRLNQPVKASSFWWSGCNGSVHQKQFLKLLHHLIYPHHHFVVLHSNGWRRQQFLIQCCKIRKYQCKTNCWSYQFKYKMQAVVNQLQAWWFIPTINKWTTSFVLYIKVIYFFPL